MKMCNVGGMDRVLRILVGIGFAVLGYFAPSMGFAGAWQMGFYIVAGIGVVTGLLTICPLYALLGVNTCNPKPATG